MSSMFQSASVQYTQEVRLKQDLIDRTNESIAQLSTLTKTESQRLEQLRTRIRLRRDRTQRIDNLKQWIHAQQHNLSITPGLSAELNGPKKPVGYADTEGVGVVIRGEDLPYDLRAAADTLIRKSSDGPAYLSTPLPLDLSHLSSNAASAAAMAKLPSIATLRHRLEAYIENNSKLADRARQLKEKDGQLEAMYRKVVSLCTKVPENMVDSHLEGLIQALESDERDVVEVGRVREFLRKVEGVEA